MPAKKAMIPAPIDRPLARAYLRQFTGWSTAHPPGLSDPTSFRIMENVMINKDTSARIRPGLRYLSYAMPPTDIAAGTPLGFAPVGSHEAFFLNDGSKAYLFAVRENDGTVGFRVLRPAVVGSVVQLLTDAGISFSIPQGQAAINFTAATTYVKYLQVDNKIFALSNAGESMRMFFVGETKIARKLISLGRPNWDVTDKLTVLEPDAPWITNGVPLTTRTNLLNDPGCTAYPDWFDDMVTTYTSVETTPTPQAGTTSTSMTSRPTKSNLSPAPLHDVVTTGITLWGVSNNLAGSISAVGSSLQINVLAGALGRNLYATNGLMTGVYAGGSFKVSYDLTYISASCSLATKIKFYTANGVQVGVDQNFAATATLGRIVSPSIIAPAGAVLMKAYIGLNCNSTSSRTMRFNNVLVATSTTATTFFSGASGANYYWAGTVNASQSVYQPAVNVARVSNRSPVVPGASRVAAVWLQSSAVGMSANVGIRWYDSAGATISTSQPANTALTQNVWVRVSHIAVAPAGATQAALIVIGLAVPRTTNIYMDSALFEQETVLLAAFDGDTASTASFAHTWNGAANASTSTEKTYNVAATVPTAETPTANTLISTNIAPNLNTFNFGFFYVFSNEVGDSAASQITVIKTQRSWSSWKWQTPNGVGEPSGTDVADPAQAADQLVAIMSQTVFDYAIANGATSWSLYMMTWSDQDSVPVEALKVVERKLTPTSLRAADGWGRVTPQNNIFNDTATLPTEGNRYNFSNPSRAGQGLVAADRMILVKDAANLAVIRWSSNRQGHYTDFSANRGGGYKTLTSGNLFIPASVKLWRNPQAVTTLAILCSGTDGHSTGYYMTPGDVTSQSDLTKVMSFEETVATPGTTSPYGCEAMNNSLIHPLDDQLMKSTGSYYNISHKSMTELIDLDWQQLEGKDKIVSSQLGTRIYYIVNNPQGENLQPGCNGNELWVLDSGGDAAAPWSRFLIQAQSLRTIENGGKVYMSVVTADGIYYLDPLYDSDDYVNGAVISSRYIPWRVETNTQGANRAHDVWAHLQQMLITLGFFQGSMTWGLRSKDVHGKVVNVSKTYRDLNPPDTVNMLPYDIEDSLLIRKDVQQWYFYAGSIVEAGVVQRSFGQINTLQYRYAPLSVNIGYERGSIQTFEYGRAIVNEADRNTDAGVPQPYTDVGRP